MAENRYIDKSVVKIFEIWEEIADCLWSFIVYVGAGSDSTTDISVNDNMKSLRIVVKPLELLLHNRQMFYEQLLIQDTGLVKWKSSKCDRKV